MRGRRAGLTLIALLLAACEPASDIGDSPFAPVGRIDAAPSVDGLTVGHRLMEAGEYELALKSFHRAAAEEGLTAEVLSSIGSANLRLGRLGQAERQLRKATETDETFAPAWNNLGVVLMEQNNYGEASRVFRIAFALDSGESVDIRENLRLALAKLYDPGYIPEDNTNFALVRRGTGDFLLETLP